MMARSGFAVALAVVLAVAGCTPSPSASPTCWPSAEPRCSPEAPGHSAVGGSGTAASATTAGVPPTSAIGATTTASATAGTSPATMLVTLYFGNTVLNPGSADCSLVYAVSRGVPASGDRLRATLQALLAGPTAEEAAQGYVSWFSPATATALIGAKVAGTTTYVNVADLRGVIPNASTSCGSAALLAQLSRTAQQAGMTPRALFAINGDPRTFWEWLQLSCGASNDDCDPAPFTS